MATWSQGPHDYHDQHIEKIRRILRQINEIQQLSIRPNLIRKQSEIPNDSHTFYIIGKNRGNH